MEEGEKMQADNQNKNSINYFSFLFVLVAGAATSISPFISRGGISSKTPIFGWTIFILVFFFLAAMIDFFELKDGSRNKTSSIKDFINTKTGSYLAYIILFHGIVCIFAYAFEKTS